MVLKYIFQLYEVFIKSYRGRAKKCEDQFQDRQKIERRARPTINPKETAFHNNAGAHQALRLYINMTRMLLIIVKKQKNLRIRHKLIEQRGI